MSIYATVAEIGLDDKHEETRVVLAFLTSHIFPSPDDPPAVVDLAVIPAHCVPGQTEDDFERVGEFLRLGVEGTEVVLTVDGARQLRDALDVWLAAPKVRAEKGQS